MNKITDLRREIMVLRRQRAISDIADIKANFSKPYYELAEEVVGKIADSIIGPMLVAGDSKEVILNNIVSMVSDSSNISVSVMPDISGTTKELFESVVYHKNYSRRNRPQKSSVSCYKAIKIVLSDTCNNSIEFITSPDVKLKKNARGYWCLRTIRRDYEYVCDFAVAMAEVYLCNQVYKYIGSNKDMAIYALLCKMDSSQSFPDADVLDMINEYNVKMNMPVINVKAFCNEINCNRFATWLKDVVNDRPLMSLSNMYSLDRQHNGLSFNRLSHEGMEKVTLYLSKMVSEDDEIKNSLNYTRENATSYAASYETKKGISNKVLERMKDNDFLGWFGYVEFDDLVDLGKVSQLEYEFAEWATHVGFPVSKVHSLRFRKLGKHHALGLYFGGHAKAVCIDLRSPNSMVHELMHEVDDLNMDGRLSSRYDFWYIIDVYKRLVSEAVAKLPSDNPEFIRFFGKTKYNKDYFFEPTEVFARVGEAFFRRIVGCDNSILSECNTIYYPKDEHLMDLVEKYFSERFPDIGKNKVQRQWFDLSSVCPANSSSFNIAVREKLDGQLSLVI